MVWMCGARVQGCKDTIALRLEAIATRVEAAIRLQRKERKEAPARLLLRGPCAERETSSFRLGCCHAPLESSSEGFKLRIFRALDGKVWRSAVYTASAESDRRAKRFREMYYKVRY